MMERPIVVLPQPDSPTMPTHSPSSTWNETPSTATTSSAGGTRSQVLDLENGGHRPPPRRARTGRFRTISPGYLRNRSADRTSTWHAYGARGGHGAPERRPFCARRQRQSLTLCRIAHVWAPGGRYVVKVVRLTRGPRRGPAVVVSAVLASCSTGAAPSSSRSGALGSGAKQHGGTATWAEAPGARPDFIFPFMNLAYFTVANIKQFQYLMYRPLYWFGTGGQPTLNATLSLAETPVLLPRRHHRRRSR